LVTQDEEAYDSKMFKINNNKLINYENYKKKLINTENFIKLNENIKEYEYESDKKSCLEIIKKHNSQIIIQNFNDYFIKDNESNFKENNNGELKKRKYKYSEDEDEEDDYDDYDEKKKLKLEFEVLSKTYFTRHKKNNTKY